MHGLAGMKELWSEFSHTLATAGFCAIAYDHRGHGESSDVRPPWTIGDLADDLAAVLDALDVERACLVGHSMGGRMLFQFAVSRPARVWGLVPVGAHSEAPHSPYREVLQDVRDATQHGGLEAFRKAFEAAGEIPERGVADLDFAAQFNADFARNRPAMLVAALDAILSMPTLTPLLTALAVPTLSVVGDRDGAFREMAALYEQIMPSCRTVVVADSHHYPMTDRPAAFAACVLPFLQNVRPHG
jgi:pimeloyl-ACP methyl ester carboxylesterase